MNERENIEKNNEEHDKDASSADHLRSLLLESTKQQSIPTNPISFDVTDNKIPPRGTQWYIGVTLAIMISTGLVIYLQDWYLLFFIIVFSGVILWRGHKGSSINLGFDDEGMSLNKKRFSFDDIDTFYFSKFGEDTTITFRMIKRYYPRITFILSSNEDSQIIRQRLVTAEVPESESRDEGFMDHITRKLKL